MIPRLNEIVEHLDDILFFAGESHLAAKASEGYIRGYIGIMENKMETTIVFWVVWGGYIRIIPC